MRSLIKKDRSEKDEKHLKYINAKLRNQHPGRVEKLLNKFPHFNKKKAMTDAERKNAARKNMTEEEKKS